jgi:hypothetical protein
LSQIAAPDARQSDFSRDNIRTLHSRRSAGRINRLANSRSCISYPDPQGIRWASRAFAQHTLPRIRDDGVCLCPSAVNSQHKLAAMNLSGGHKIRYLGLRLHHF